MIIFIPSQKSTKILSDFQNDTFQINLDDDESITQICCLKNVGKRDQKAKNEYIMAKKISIKDVAEIWIFDINFECKGDAE